jgi:hypothetical protein
MRWLAVASLALLAGCSSNGSSSSGSSSDPFVGTYSCSNSYTLTYTTPAGAKPTTGTSSFTNVVVDDGDGTYTSTSTGDAGTSCTLKHSYSGSSSTLVNGQTCTFGGLVYTYTAGTASISGKTVTTSNQWSFTGTVDTAGQTVQVAGSGTSMGTCTAQ